MDLTKYMEVSDIRELTGAEHVVAARAMLKAGTSRLEEERKSVEEHPERNLEDLKRDIVHRIGFIAGLKWMLSLPQEARKLLEKEERK